MMIPITGSIFLTSIIQGLMAFCIYVHCLFWPFKMTVFKKRKIKITPIIKITKAMCSIRVRKRFVFEVVVHAAFIVMIFQPLKTQ